jgi:hypothetical protein
MVADGVARERRPVVAELARPVAAAVVVARRQPALRLADGGAVGRVRPPAVVAAAAVAVGTAGG